MDEKDEKKVNPARCAWEVTAGVLPGEPMEDYTRRFVMNAEELNDRGEVTWLEKLGAATMYATSLQDPSRLNWVRLEWVWY